MTSPPSGETAAVLPRPAAPPPVRGIVSILSGTNRSGRWEVPPHMRVATVFGNVQLDMREADIPPGGVLIEVAAGFAAVEVTVPPTVRVECDGDALAGTYSIEVGGRPAARSQPPALPPVPPWAPLVRVRGNIYFSNVTVRVCGPGEHPEDAHRR